MEPKTTQGKREQNRRESKYYCTQNNIVVQEKKSFKTPASLQAAWKVAKKETSSTGRLKNYFKNLQLYSMSLNY